MLKVIMAGLRRAQTQLAVAGKRRFLTAGDGLHVGRGSRLWAPRSLQIGRCVYIGKHVNIEANAEIGDYCLIANHVALIGRHDHDFSAVGFPMRFSPWIGSKKFPSKYVDEKIVIGADTWIGFGAKILTGVVIGKGCVVAAGSIVTKDIPPYAIAAGTPARVVGMRFSSLQEIIQHEQMISDGLFGFSEKGYDDCVIMPGKFQAGG